MSKKVEPTENPQTEKCFFNVRELSEYIGVKVATLYSWVYVRKIPFVKLGGLLRFDKQEIEKWIDQNRVGTREFDFDGFLSFRGEEQRH